jgi:hypothetical protein
LGFTEKKEEEHYVSAQIMVRSPGGTAGRQRRRLGRFGPADPGYRQGRRAGAGRGSENGAVVTPPYRTYYRPYYGSYYAPRYYSYGYRPYYSYSYRPYYYSYSYRPYYYSYGYRPYYYNYSYRPSYYRRPYVVARPVIYVR